MSLDKSVSENFFGRETLIEFLYKTVLSAKDGGAVSTLLSGARGVGKTKLLSNLYTLVFERQDGVAPFLYTIQRSFVSAEDFSNDYLGSFILQRLAFQEKDTAGLSGIYSLENIRNSAKEFGAQWAVDMLDDYMRVREEGCEAKTVLKAVSVPLRSYQITGVPVVVMIDDLDRIRQFFELKGNDINPCFWMPFESSIRSMHIPHIFSGVPHEIERMFFENNPSRDHLEMIDLPCLNRADSIKLFRSLCEMYGLKVELTPADFIGRFGGNPLYIKNFLQSVRQTGEVLSKDLFQQTYYNEITSGKTYKYWTFLLKKYIHQLDLRRPSLWFLYGLCSDSSPDPTNLHLSEQVRFKRISELLHSSGIVETGFIEMRVVDNVLTDIVEALYLKEVKKEPLEKVRKCIIDNGSSQVQDADTASFIITIPANPKAGLVAIKSFEQIAKNYNIPLQTMEKLQLAMADLFTNVLWEDASVESFKLQVKCFENSFSVEITTPQKGLVLTEPDSTRIGAYVDDLKLDGNGQGTVITLVQGIVEHVSPPSDD